jgi:hydroxyacylglutathione hydrolase
VTHLIRVGLDDIEGYLDDGIHAWEDHGYEISQLESISVHELAARLADAEQSPFVLDVRTEQEWDASHIEGATHIHGGLLQERFAEVPRDRPVTVICGSGYRGSIAASFLKREGYQHVSNVLGGMTAWRKSERPVAD